MRERETSEVPTGAEKAFLVCRAVCRDSAAALGKPIKSHAVLRRVTKATTVTLIKEISFQNKAHNLKYYTTALTYLLCYCRSLRAINFCSTIVLASICMVPVSPSLGIASAREQPYDPSSSRIRNFLISSNLAGSEPVGLKGGSISSGFSLVWVLC